MRDDVGAVPDVAALIRATKLRAHIRRVGKAQRAHHFDARSMIDGGHVADAPLPTLRSRAHHRVGQQSREQQQSRIAVGLEYRRHSAGSLMFNRLICQTRCAAKATSPIQAGQRAPASASAMPISTTASE